MKSLKYIAVTQPGKVEKHFVGRVSVDGDRVIVEFPVLSAHVAKVTAERLNYAVEHQGEIEGTAVTVPSPPHSR